MRTMRNPVFAKNRVSFRVRCSTTKDAQISFFLPLGALGILAVQLPLYLLPLELAHIEMVVEALLIQ